MLAALEQGLLTRFGPDACLNLTQFPRVTGQLNDEIRLTGLITFEWPPTLDTPSNA